MSNPPAATPPAHKPLRCAVGLLKADPQNPRTIEAPALRGLGVSMETFGDLSGIVWNERSGNLVAGHQRMNRLKAAGADHWTRISKTEGFIIHPKTKERFAIRIADWDETTERMANLTANNTEIQGDFTEEAAEQLRALEDDERFQDLMLHELQADLDKEVKRLEEERAQGNTDPDDVPEPPAEATTKPGDLWILGEHRILCGDSSNPKDIKRLMGSERAGLMNTDPPYGVSYANDDRPNPGVAKPRVANDSLTDETLQAFLESCFRAAVAHALKPDAAWYLWHAHLTQGYFAAAAAAAAAKVVLHRQIIWVKPVLLLGRGHYHWKHEPCFMGWVQGHQPPDYGLGNGERTQTTVWEIDSVTRAERAEFNHSTPKPVALFETPMVKHLRKGELAFEPFSGSGPQIIAGERLGRRVFACEIEPRYVDVAVARWEAFTGKKATREKADPPAPAAAR